MLTCDHNVAGDARTNLQPGHPVPARFAASGERVGTPPHGSVAPNEREPPRKITEFSDGARRQGQSRDGLVYLARLGSDVGRGSTRVGRTGPANQFPYQLAQLSLPEFKDKYEACRDDSDRDGIPSCIDQCPKTSEDFDNVDDYDGCPDAPNNRAYGMNPAIPSDFGTRICAHREGEPFEEGVRKCVGDVFGRSPTMLPRLTGMATISSGGGGSVFDPDGGISSGREPGIADSPGDGTDGEGRTSTPGPSLRRSSNFGKSISAVVNVSAGPVSFGVGGSLGESASYIDQEFMDWNGDGLPDRVAPGEVVLSGNGAVISPDDATWHLRFNVDCFFPSVAPTSTVDCRNNPSVRETDNLTVSFGLNAGGAIAHRDVSGGRNKEQAVVGKAQASFGTNAQASFSSPEVERVDVNGDGLPDLLVARQLDDGKTHLLVRLNFGYALGEIEDWGELPNVGAFRSQFAKSLNVRPTIGATENLTVSRGFGGGGGVNLLGIIQVSASVSHSQNVTGSMTSVVLIDLNKDGLPDFVTKSPGGDMQVHYNRGGSLGGAGLFGQEGKTLRLRPWAQGPLLPDVQQILDFHGVSTWVTRAIQEEQDALYTHGSSVESVAGTVEGGLFWVKVSGTYYHKWGHSFMEGGLSDIDGDGLPDRVLRQGREPAGAIQYQRNMLGGANLLRAITSPLGGRIELNYELKQPSTEDPAARWVLASTTMMNAAENVANTAPITATFNYESPYYDRYERMFHYRQQSRWTV